MNTPKKRGRPAGQNYVPHGSRITPEQKAHIESLGGSKYLRDLIQADIEAREVHHESN